MAANVPLSELLFGRPLVERSENNGDECVGHLDAVIGACIFALKEEVGEGVAFDQAKLEWGNALKNVNSDTMQGAVARRAALLLFLFKIPAVEAHYRRLEPGLVNDLMTRVLPLLIPRFVSNMGQSPDALVMSTIVMVHMWKDVQIGTAHG